VAREVVNLQVVFILAVVVAEPLEVVAEQVGQVILLRVVVVDWDIKTTIQ
jgi:hypothetical protein